MKTNELQKQLMIGNYLLGKIEDELDERKVYWEEYQIKDAEDLMGVKMDWDKPIHLTEEWLLKFGFEKKDGMWTISNFNGYLTKYHPFNGENGYKHFVMNCGMLNIRFVHQLQNLFCILTSEELKLQ